MRHDNELTIKLSPFVFLKWVVVVEFFFTFLPFIAAWLSGLGEADYETLAPFANTVPYTLFLAIGVTTLQVLIIAVSFVAWYFPVYQANAERIIYRRGDLFEQRKIADTPKIEDITVRQSGWGRQFNYGSLHLQTGDNGRPPIIKNIPNPAHYAELILAMVDPAATAVAPPVTQTLDELLDGGETQYVEYKSSLMWDYYQERVNKALYTPVMKTLVAFMNTSGGVLLIGVDDEGQVLGLSPDLSAVKKGNTDGFENVFNTAFNKMVGVEMRQYLDVTFPQMDGETICMVRARPSPHPAYLTDKGVEKFYIRAGNASQPLTVSQAARYIQNHFHTP